MTINETVVRSTVGFLESPREGGAGRGSCAERHLIDRVTSLSRHPREGGSRNDDAAQWLPRRTLRVLGFLPSRNDRHVCRRQVVDSDRGRRSRFLSPRTQRARHRPAHAPPPASPMLADRCASPSPQPANAAVCRHPCPPVARCCCRCPQYRETALSPRRETRTVAAAVARAYPRRITVPRRQRAGRRWSCPTRWWWRCRRQHRRARAPRGVRPPPVRRLGAHLARWRR